jgi:hypothetical protein
MATSPPDDGEKKSPSLLSSQLERRIFFFFYSNIHGELKIAPWLQGHHKDCLPLLSSEDRKSILLLLFHPLRQRRTSLFSHTESLNSTPTATSHATCAVLSHVSMRYSIDRRCTCHRIDIGPPLCRPSPHHQPPPPPIARSVLVAPHRETTAIG